MILVFLLDAIYQDGNRRDGNTDVGGKKLCGTGLYEGVDYGVYVAILYSVVYFYMISKLRPIIQKRSAEEAPRHILFCIIAVVIFF